VHQTKVVTALRDNARDNIFLADVRLADVIDRISRRGSQRGRAVSHPLMQLHRELRVVEDADPVTWRNRIIPSA
jgi:hypothetical protein